MEARPRPPLETIPEPTADVLGLHRTCLALKQAVEQMQGQRGRSHGGLSEQALAGSPSQERKATIHIADQPPHDPPDGDFWLAKGGLSSSLSVAINGNWIMVWP